MDEYDFVVVHWEGRTDVALGLVKLPSELDVDLATLRSMIESQVEAIALQRKTGAGKDWDYRFLLPNRGAVAADRMEKGRVVVKKVPRAAPAYVPIGRRQEIELFLSDLLVGSPDDVGPSIVLRSVKASDEDKPAGSKREKKTGCVFNTVVGLMVAALFLFLAFHSIGAHEPHHHEDHHGPWGGQQNQPQPPRPWWNEGINGQGPYTVGGAYPGGMPYGGDAYSLPPPEPQMALPPERMTTILIIDEPSLQQPPLMMPQEEQTNKATPEDWPIMGPEDARAPSCEEAGDMGSSDGAVDLPAPMFRRQYQGGDSTASSSDELQIQIDVPVLMVMPREELPNPPSDGGAFIDPAQFPPPPQYQVDPVPPRDYGRDTGIGFGFVAPQPEPVPPQFMVDPMPGGAPWDYPGGPDGMPWAHPGGHHHGDHHGYRSLERVALAIVYTVGSSVDGYFRTFVSCWAEMGTWLVRLIDAYFGLLQFLIERMLQWPVVVVLVVAMAIALHYAQRIIATVLPYKAGDLKNLAAVAEEDLAHVDDLVDEECPKLKA